MSAAYESLTDEELAVRLRWGNSGDHLIYATAEALARLLEKKTVKHEIHNHYAPNPPLFQPKLNIRGPYRSRPLPY